MSDKLFDDIFRKKIASYHPDPDPLSWFSLENQLDQLDSDNAFNDEKLDLVIKDKLDGHKVNYKPTHWNKLKSLLDLEEEMNRKIYITKLIEFAIVLLLIFSFFHLEPLDRLGINNPNIVDLQEKIPNQIKLSRVTPINTPNSQPTSISSVNTSQNSLNPHFSNIKLNRLASVHLVLDEIPSREKINSSFESKKLKSPSLLSENPIGGIEFSRTTPELFATDRKNSKEEFQMVNSEQVSKLTWKRHQILPVIQPPRVAKEHWFGIFTSIDLNVINRSLDLRVFQQPELFGALGHTLGIQYSTKFGKHEIETGASYSLKSYNPNLHEQLYLRSSTYEREFNKQTFRILQVPIAYKWHSSSHRSWNFYPVAGISFNILASTEYHFDNILKNGQPKAENVIEKSSKLNNTLDFHNGLFQGGSAFKNIYMTALVGFGFEKYVGNHSFYIQPQYTHHLFSQQLGPNNEKLNTLSLQVGTKIKL